MLGRSLRLGTCAPRHVFYCVHLSTGAKFSPFKSSFPNISEDQWTNLCKFSDCVADWNQKVNIVSRKDIDDLVPNHIIPALSVSLVKSFGEGESVIDIGSGGGLPGLPLAIICSDTQFTLLDSNSKKMGVVRDMVKTLGLKNVNVVTSRSEAFTQQFDVLVARGVAALPTFLVNTSHLLKKQSHADNGLFYIKGGDFDDELRQARIKEYSLHPVRELVEALPQSDKFVLHIPTKEMLQYEGRRVSSRK